MVQTRDTYPEDFRSKTERGLVACGKWLEENAEDLSRAIANGCRRWSVEFSFDCTEDFCPSIDISVNRVSKEIVNAYVDDAHAEEDE